MKWINKGLVILLLIVLVACQNDPLEEEQLVLVTGIKGDYSMVVDFVSSKTRDYHGTYLGRYDAIEIGKRLVEKSKQHFDVQSHFLQEGQIITNDILTRLVRRESATNVAGLNPASGSEFDIGDGRRFILDAVMVADVVEVNFVGPASQGYPLKGLGIAIVFNQTQTATVNGVPNTTVTISDERLYQYASDVGRKLESYLRSLTGVGDLPIYITLYSTKSADSFLPGSFIGEGYFVARSGQFIKNNESWVLFPSNDALMLDPNTSTNFNGLKQTLQTLLPEAVGVIGKGRYVNQELNYLKININMIAKTYSEVIAITQTAMTIIERFDNKDAHIVVEVLSQSMVMATIQRLPNESNLTVIYNN